MRNSFPKNAWGGMFVTVGLAAAFAAAVEPAVDAPGSLARRLYQEGKYAESEEAYRALASEQDVPAALGLARCQESVGQRDKAIATLAAAARHHPDVASLPAELARLALDRGDHQAAEASTALALKLDANQLMARWVQAELFAAQGKLAEANAAYEWLVNYSNEHEVEDVDARHRIALAAAQFARWNRLSDQFTFLVNELYPDLVAAEPAYWQAHYESGRLFAEKYNQADALKAFKAALVINPNAAEVHASLGQLSLLEFEIKAAQAHCDRALEINPQLLLAMQLKADIHLANFEPRQAIGVCQDALKLNARAPEILGRLAAAYIAMDGLGQRGPDTRFGKVVLDVTDRNPHAGAFFESLAEALDRLRRWPLAAEYFQEAMTRMPQLVSPAGSLGMMLMRLGEEERARQALNAAFEADPFNVRVNNSLKVLEVLDDYETLETEHFRIKFDPAHDKILAGAMARWLEEVYPQLVKQMGFAPPDKSLFEVFSRAKNTDGHGWFSARMVGLPHIHPIGACAGKIVALQSPTEGKQRFNWARVVKHEFIHVINLQQTQFNIPHWFTEGLAVLNEGYPRPQSWNEILSKRFADKKLFNLDTINFGFIRPHSTADWNLAYCQAELYAQFMLDRFGEDAIAKVLAAYADNLTTPEAIRRAFNVEQTDFERGYDQFIEKTISEIRATDVEEMSLGEIQRALSKKPHDANLLAQMAKAHLDRRGYPEARRSADAALAVDPQNALAHYVRARLHLLVGENQAALERLEKGLDREKPQENLLGLLAGLKLKAENYSQAAELYELGAKHQPGNPKWQKSLAAVYLKSGDEKKLVNVLTQLAAADADDLAVRNKLAQLAQKNDDAAGLARWAAEALQIDVMNGQLHEWLGEALAKQDKLGEAAREYAAAVELDPDELKLRLSLAEIYVKAREPEKAKAALSELLALDPQYPGAAELLESPK